MDTYVFVCYILGWAPAIGVARAFLMTDSKPYESDTICFSAMFGGLTWFAAPLIPPVAILCGVGYGLYKLADLSTRIQFDISRKDG